MEPIISIDRLRFLSHRLRERLWVRPLFVCLLSVGAAFVAKLADDMGLANFVPNITSDSIETLLSIMASSMLVIATFSVASMVSAYASASSTATPRSFRLVVADDVSQNALSTFVGAFIFSLVALMATKNTYFEKAGLFVLFILTTIVFGMVIITFVRWVDSIARLGRIGSTIDKIEKATADAFKQRQRAPALYGVPLMKSQERGQPVFVMQVGYVQHIDMAAIQVWAEAADAQVVISALPGTLAAPDRALAFVSSASGNTTELDTQCLIKAFQIGHTRLFEDDPRFGLVVLSEIASRALSPAVNDPGTAINVIGVLLRLFVQWHETSKDVEVKAPKYDRITVPLISIEDMLDDAFSAIARDGAGMVEVSIRLQKALATLASLGQSEMKQAAIYQGQLALKRANIALDTEEDLAIIREAANYTTTSFSIGTESTASQDTESVN